MSGLFDFVRIWLRRRNVRKLLLAAQAWPVVSGEINHWEVRNADPAELTSSTPCQIEARFHFSLNGEYFGGYLRSVPMGQHQAETFARGTPTINIRYNPANPDSTIVLPEDNPATLPFRISTGA